MNKVEFTINHIGSKIKYYRQLNKISLSKLASLANISKSTLFGLEEGKSNPTISTLINIADTLNLDVKELIGSSKEIVDSKLESISVATNKEYSLYKLSLNSNELYRLNNSNSIKIKVLDGGIFLINSNISLLRGDTIISNNELIKAHDNGAVALIKIYKAPTTIYTSNDIFVDKVSTELLNEVALKTLNGLINRVVVNTLTPHENFNKIKYINYIEDNQNREYHYYFFKRFVGLFSSYITTLKKANIEPKSSNLNKLNELIELSTTNKEFNRENLNLINISPLDFAKNSIIEELSSKDPNLIVITSLHELLSIKNKENNSILLITDLINSTYDEKNLSFIIGIYRLLESIYLFKDNLLNEDELKLHNLLVLTLSKALYYSLNKQNNFAINCIKSLINETKSIEFNTNESIVVNRYLNIISKLNKLINNTKTVDNLETIELIAKDLGYNIELKELISPVVDKSGLYIYILNH